MTNTADIKKKVKELIKEKSSSISINELEMKITLNGCKVYKNKTEIGTIDLSYVSSTASGFGSLFGVYAGCRVIGGNIVSVLEKMELSFPRFREMPGYFSTTSLSEKFKKFGERGGIIPFYEKDNLDEKCAVIIQKINSFYVPRFENFALGKVEVIEDILESPMDYAYPMASIIVACYLNDNKELVEQSIKNSKSKKLHDAGSSRVQEVLEKVQKALN